MLYDQQGNTIHDNCIGWEDGASFPHTVCTSVGIFRHKMYIKF